MESQWQFTLGLYYEDVDNDRTLHALFAGDPALNGDSTYFPFSSSIAQRNITQKAVFGKLYYDLSDNLKLTAGGRFFNYERSESVVLLDPSIDLGFDPNNLTDDVDDSDSSLDAGVEYSPNEETLIYANWSEGFRLGFGVPELIPFFKDICDQDDDGFFDGSNGLTTSSRAIESDFVDNYELGTKLSLLDNRLGINAAIFQTNWEGIPVVESFSTSCVTTVNAGEAQSLGAELETTYLANENLQLNFNASYIEAELKEDIDSIGAESGNRLPGSPRFNASFGLEYGFDLSQYEAYIRGDYTYVGGFYNSLQETGIEAGDYSTLDVNLGIAINQVDISFFVKNLTDEDKFTWVDSDFNSRGNRLRPRTIGVSAAYRF